MTRHLHRSCRWSPWATVLVLGCALAQVAAPPAAPPPAAEPAAATEPAPETPAPAVAPAAEVVTEGSQDEQGLRLNFQNAPISTVLDFLSRAAGFVIVHDAPLSGTITIVSQQPLSATEAAGLLHTVLNDRGYAMVRQDRVLRVVRVGDARTRNLPVYSGHDPEAVPKTDEVVTHVVPMRHTTAAKMLETLRPLLPPQTTTSVNEDSNAIVFTDTRINIRHLMEIIQALDTAVASILDIRVIPLRYADATDTAAVINKVFTPPTAASRGSQSPPSPFQFFGRMRGGPGGDSGGGDTAGNEAKQTAAYVSATADSRANAVVVTAPSEMLAQVQDLVAQLDIPSDAISTLQVFPLRYADATEIANVLAGLYPSNSSTAGRTTQGTAQMGGGRGAFFRQMMPQTPQSSTNNQSERKLAEATVVAVADTRTNSVIVSASPGTMANIETVIRQLDATPANVPNVHIYRMQNGDPAQAKAILEGMFDKLYTTGGSTSGTSSSTPRTSTSGNPRSSSGGGTSSRSSGSSSGGTLGTLPSGR